MKGSDIYSQFIREYSHMEPPSYYVWHGSDGENPICMVQRACPEVDKKALLQSRFSLELCIVKY